jgi:hypothetical protein
MAMVDSEGLEPSNLPSASRVRFRCATSPRIPARGLGLRPPRGPPLQNQHQKGIGVGWWTRRDSNPQISRVRAGCASVALRAHVLLSWGDRRESNPHSGSHRPVRFPYATTTVSFCSGPPGRNRTVIDRLSGGCTSLVLRAEKTAGGEQGIRTPRPMSWATRLAGGHLAPVQDGLSRSVGEAGIEPATSRSRTARAAAALHPDLFCGRRGSRFAPAWFACEPRRDGDSLWRRSRRPR